MNRVDVTPGRKGRCDPPSFLNGVDTIADVVLRMGSMRLLRCSAPSFFGRRGRIRRCSCMNGVDVTPGRKGRCDPPSFFRRALTLSPMLFCEWGRCDPWAEGSGRVHAATAFLTVSKKMRSEPTLKKPMGFKNGGKLMRTARPAGDEGAMSPYRALLRLQ